jgi:hypothetical protein
MNSGTTQGQAMLSGLQTALSRHQRVDIQGTGTCAGGHELVQYLILVGQ